MKISIKNNRGFVLLFAVTIASIILAIALGVSNIALKEIKFSTSVRDTNDAFFAADTGVEQALYNDKNSATYPAPSSGSQSWSFVISGLGSRGLGCSAVTVTKSINNSIVLTTILAKGYSIGNASCNSSNPDRTERELQVSYNSNGTIAANTCDTNYYGDQFHVCYFDGISAPQGAVPVLSQSHETDVPSPTGPWGSIDHDWQFSQVADSGKSDQVSAVWRGRINFQAGDYYFHTISDDGVILNIEGYDDVISNWGDHGATQDNSSQISIPAGPRNVRLSWYENGGGATIKFWWDGDPGSDGGGDGGGGCNDDPECECINDSGGEWINGQCYTDPEGACSARGDCWDFNNCHSCNDVCNADQCCDPENPDNCYGP